MNQLLAHLNAKHNGDISSGMVINAIVPRSGKTLGRDVELDDDPDGRTNDKQVNVKIKRPNDDDLKSNEVIIECFKVKEPQIVSMPPIKFFLFFHND